MTDKGQPLRLDEHASSRSLPEERLSIAETDHDNQAVLLRVDDAEKRANSNLKLAKDGHVGTSRTIGSPSADPTRLY